MTRLVLCAKSNWHPAIRREHEIAQRAASDGIDVVFLERPHDVRALAEGDRRAWLEHLVKPVSHAEGLVRVVPRSTAVPAHRNMLSNRVDELLLRRMLGRLTPNVVVGTVPWEWPAIAGYRGAERRIFDCADDWAKILPAQGDRLRALYKRVGREADAVICDSDALVDLFSPRVATVVRNGTPPALLATPPTPAPHTSTMAYAGTMSERFDVPLVEAVLGLLPDWRLDLYGPCQYAGRGGEPDAEFAGLLERCKAQLTWHGAVPRPELSARLDAGDVLTVPHRTEGASTGDSMKFYDYAARGRPVVTTAWSEEIARIVAPHTRIESTPEAFAAAVRESADDNESFVADRRRWAEANDWQASWAAWKQAAFG